MFRWYDNSSSTVTVLNSVADVSVISTTAVPTSTVGVSYVLDASANSSEQPKRWLSRGRHFGQRSFHVSESSYADRGMFDFYVTGIAYRPVGPSHNDTEPVVAFPASAASRSAVRTAIPSHVAASATYDGHSQFLLPPDSPAVVASSVDATASNAISQHVTDELDGLLAVNAEPIVLPAVPAIIEVFYQARVPRASPSQNFVREKFALPGDSGAAATVYGIDHGSSPCLFGIVKGYSNGCSVEGYITPASLALAQVRVLLHDPGAVLLAAPTCSISVDHRDYFSIGVALVMWIIDEEVMSGSIFIHVVVKLAMAISYRCCRHFCDGASSHLAFHE